MLFLIFEDFYLGIFKVLSEPLRLGEQMFRLRSMLCDLSSQLSGNTLVFVVQTFVFNLLKS